MVMNDVIDRTHDQAESVTSGLTQYVNYTLCHGILFALLLLYRMKRTGNISVLGSQSTGCLYRQL